MSWVKKSTETNDWGAMIAMVEHLIAKDPKFSWEIIYQSLGGGQSDEEPLTGSYEDWLMKYTEPAEVIGYLTYEFGELPEVEPAIIEEKRNKVSMMREHNPEVAKKAKVLEWADIANMPALPLHDEEGMPLEIPYEITEQEQRTGIKLRKITNGSFRARQIDGIYSVYGTTPHEALAKLYEKITGKIPYASSGDVV